jgi:AcrR family transcriptional regulator
MTALREGTLTAHKRRATVDWILRATRRFVAERGLDVTVDEIADAAGVGRRTVFRHFSTRDELLAAAIAAGLERYTEQVPSYDGGDWRAWVHALSMSVHRMNDSCGPGFWELATRHDLPPLLVSVEAERRRGRQATMIELAKTVWSGAGGRGKCPKTVTTAVCSSLSPHFTAAVTDDAGCDWRQAATLAEAAIETAVTSAVDR